MIARNELILIEQLAKLAHCTLRCFGKADLAQLLGNHTTFHVPYLHFNSSTYCIALGTAERLSI